MPLDNFKIPDRLTVSKEKSLVSKLSDVRVILPANSTIIFEGQKFKTLEQVMIYLGEITVEGV